MPPIQINTVIQEIRYSLIYVFTHIMHHECTNDLHECLYMISQLSRVGAVYENSKVFFGVVAGAGGGRVNYIVS